MLRAFCLFSVPQTIVLIVYEFLSQWWWRLRSSRPESRWRSRGRGCLQVCPEFVVCQPRCSIEFSVIRKHLARSNDRMCTSFLFLVPSSRWSRLYWCRMQNFTPKIMIPSCGRRTRSARVYRIDDVVNNPTLSNSVLLLAKVWKGDQHVKLCLWDKSNEYFTIIGPSNQILGFQMDRTLVFTCATADLFNNSRAKVVFWDSWDKTLHVKLRSLFPTHEDRC